MKACLNFIFSFSLMKKETNPDARSARSGRAERKTVHPFRMRLSFDLRSASKPFALYIVYRVIFPDSNYPYLLSGSLRGCFLQSSARKSKQEVFTEMPLRPLGSSREATSSQITNH